MNGTSQIVAGSMPKLSAVSPAEKLCVEVTWSEGPRAPRTETVDLSPLINSHKFYKPLRKNRPLFETVHLIDDGEVLAWGDSDAVDMAATSVERLAEEMMTPNDFKVFVASLHYTHSTAAAMLGYSRRQIENFLSGTKPIPRVCALACIALQHRSTPRQVNSGTWCTVLSTQSTADVSPPEKPLHLFAFDPGTAIKPTAITYDAP